MLELVNLSKSYGKKAALSQVSFTLESGLYGLLGPNGAGKSTLMQIMTDNLLPDEGEVLWKGESARKMGERYRELLGYMPQQQGLYKGFTGRRFLNYLAVLKNVPKKEREEQVEAAAKAVNLETELERKIGGYSGGMKQRLLFASALLGKPEILIFDEPTAGLDPKERVRIKKLMEQLSRDKIIVIATHIVPDIENIAKEIILLKEGKVVEKQKPEVLIEKYAGEGSLEDVYMHIFGQEGGKVE